MTGHLVECPIDEMNRPRGRQSKFAPAGRSYTAHRLMAEVGPRVNEVCKLDPAGVKWELGRPRLPRFSRSGDPAVTGSRRWTPRACAPVRG
jgi:hypothetical protein